MMHFPRFVQVINTSKAATPSPTIDAKQLSLWDKARMLQTDNELQMAVQDIPARAFGELRDSSSRVIFSSPDAYPAEQLLGTGEGRPGLNAVYGCNENASINVAQALSCLSNLDYGYEQEDSNSLASSSMLVETPIPLYTQWPSDYLFSSSHFRQTSASWAFAGPVTCTTPGSQSALLGKQPDRSEAYKFLLMEYISAITKTCAEMDNGLPGCREKIGRIRDQCNQVQALMDAYEGCRTKMGQSTDYFEQ